MIFFLHITLRGSFRASVLLSLIRPFVTEYYVTSLPVTPLLKALSLTWSQEAPFIKESHP